MVVKTKCAGNKVMGLDVGAYNARRYFPRHLSAIELQLDHLRIECGLSPEFWNGRPEIHDRRLCSWLESKQFHKASKNSAALIMIAEGENSFKLLPAKFKPASEGANAARPPIFVSGLRAADSDLRNSGSDLRASVSAPARSVISPASTDPVN
jgi:hypothetical protein